MTTQAHGEHVPDDYSPPPRGNPYEAVLVAILFATFGLVFFDRMALNFLVPFFKDELGLSNAAVGLLGGLPSLTWAISGICIGYLSDRTDRRKRYLLIMVVIFTLFSTLSGAVGGLASLLLLRAVMGAAEGAILPLAQPMIIYSSQPRRRGLNMGLVQGSAPGLLGGIVGPVVTTAIAAAFGWRFAFYFTVIPGFIVAVLILKYIRDLRLRHPSAASQAPSDMPGHVANPSIRSAVASRNVVVCLLISVFFVTWFITTQTFTPLYLSATKGFGPATVSFVLSGIGIAWVVWGALVPGLSDRVGRKPSIIFFAAIAALAPIVLITVDSPVALFILLILTYTGMGCFTLFMATIPAETVPPSLVATCLGLIMGTGEIVGGFIGPWAAGLISDAFGLDAAMWMCATAAAIVVVLGFFLRETAPSRVTGERREATIGERVT